MANQNFRVKNGINVGAAVTITTDEFQVGDTRIHTSGIEVKSINVSSGVSTFTNLVVSAGSTSAPSISPTGDSNTGIFFPSPDTVAIAEGGVEALRIDSSSNVGINTANPSDKLTVLGKIQVQQDSGSNNRIVLRSQPGSSYRWNVDNFGSSNTFRIFREDDATSANGAVAIEINAATRNVSLYGGNLAFDSGKGIDFSATANSSGTMTSELLSDYEEGTWTPTLVARSSNFSSVTYGVREAVYTKIGNMVYLTCALQYTAFTGGSGELRIEGIPYNISTSGDTGVSGTCVTYSYGGGWTTNYPTTVEPFSTTALQIIAMDRTGGYVNILVSNMPSTAYITFSAFYRTD